MKKLSNVMLMALVFTMIFAGCSGHNETDGGPSTLETHFESLAALEKQASNIIEVKVIDNVETIEYGDVTFTVSEALILSSLKGELKENETIRLVETGGIMKDGQEFKFNGIPVVKKDEHLYLFVEKYVGPVTEGAYIPLGVYQGKFKVTDNQIEQQAPGSDKIRDFKQTTEDDFKAIVKQTQAKNN